MAKYNITGLVVLIMMVLIAVNVGATTHNNSDYENKISRKCLADCIKKCVKGGVLPPLCLPSCLIACRTSSPQSQSDVDGVMKCTSDCAQSTCSKYIVLGNCLFVIF